MNFITLMANNLTILLIEDDEKLLEKITNKFSETLNGFEVVKIKNKTALTKALKERLVDWAIISDETKWATSQNILKKVKQAQESCQTIILYNKDDPKKKQKIKTAQKEGLDLSINRNTRTPSNLVKIISAETSTPSPTQSPTNPLLERGPVGMIRCTPEGGIIDVNNAAVSILNYPDKDSLLKKAMIDLYVNPEDRENIKKALIAGQSIQGLEVNMITYQGMILPMWVSGEMILNDQGKIDYFEGSIENISHTKQIAKALAETELLNQNIIDSIFDGVIVLDPNSEIKVWNRFMELITGIPASQTQGKKIFEVFPELTAEPFEQLKNRILGGESFRSSDTPYYIKDIESQGWIESFYGPLLSPQGETIGIIATFHEITDRKEREKEKEVLLKVETQRTQELTAITTATATISSNLNIHEVLSVVADQMMTVLNVDTCTILEWNQVDNTTSLLAASSPVETTQPKHNNLDDRPLILNALKNKTSLQMHATDNDLPKKGKDYLSQEGIQSLLMVPLITKNQTLGLIELNQLNREHVFTEQEVILARMLADQAAIAIQNARLYDATRTQLKQLSILHTLTAAGAQAQTEDEFIKAATELISSAYYPEHFGFLMKDPDEPILYHHSSYICSNPELHRPIKLNEGISGKTARTGMPQLIHNVAEEPDYLVLDNRARSELCVPLIIGDEVIGVINTERPALNAFDQNDLQLLTVFASQISLTIERLRAKQTEAKKTRQLNILNELGQRMTGILNRRELVNLVTQTLVREFDFYNCGILSYESGADELVLEAISGVHEIQISPGEYRQPIDVGLIGKAARTKTYILANDVTQEPDFHQLEEADVKSELVFPLMVENKVIGCIAINSDIPNAFDAGEVATLGTLADQLALALEKTRLFEVEQQQRQQAETLREIAETISTETDKDQVLNLVLHQLKQVLDFDNASIMLIAGDEMEIAASSSKDFLGMNFKVAENKIAHPMIYEGKTELHNNIKKHPDWMDAPGADVIASWIGAPLIARGECIGLLTVDGYEENQFTENDAQLVSVFASHSATAIENARLFEIEQQQRQQAETLREIATTISTETEKDEVLKLILQQLQKVVPYDSASVILIDGEVMRIEAVGGNLDPKTFIGLTFTLSENKITHPIIYEKNTVVHTNIHNIDEWLVAPGTEKIISWIGAPLIYQGKCLGVLTVDGYQEAQFSQTDADTVSIFATHAATAIQNARLFEETAQALAREQQINQISQSLREGLDIGNQLNEIIKLICQTIGADGGTIGILSPDKKILQYKFGYREFQKQLVDIPKGEGLGWEVVNTEKPILLSNYLDHPKAMKEIPLRSCIIVPFRSKDEIIGVVNIYNYNSTKEFNSRDLALVETIAQQMGIAYQNSRLFDETTQALKREQQLNQITQRLTETTDTDTLLNEIIKLTCEAINGDAGTIGLLTPNGQEIQHNHAYQEKDIEHQVISYGQGVSWEVLNSLEPILLDDYHSHPKSLPEFKAKAYLIVPFLSGNKPIGVFNIYNIESEGKFDHRDLALVESITRQLGIAFENAQLFEETTQSLQREQQLNQITQQLTEGLNIDVVLNDIVKYTCQAVNADSGSVGLISPDGSELVFQFGYNIENPHKPTTPKGEGLGWKIIESKKPVFLADYKNHPEAISDINVRSFIGIPLSISKKIIGMIGIYNTTDDKFFDERDLTLVESIVLQAGIAMENAHLFQETTQALTREQQLNRITLKLSEGLAIDEMLKEIVEMTCQAVGADSGAVGLITPDRKHIDFTYVFPTQDNIEQITIEKGEGVGWHIVETEKSILIEDYNAHPLAVANVDARSFIGVPLKFEKKMIGVFGVYTTTSERSLDERDLALVESIARQAAITIQNTRLFEETNQALTREQKLNQISSTLSRNLDINILLDDVTKSATEVLGADAGVIGLLNKETGELEDDYYFYNRPKHITRENTEHRRTGLMPLAIQTGKGFLVEDYAKHPNASPTWINAGFHASIMVPLTTEEEIIGGLGVFAQNKKTIFTQRDLELAESIARQAAIAFQKARLFEETKQRTKDLEALYSLTSSISENLGLETLLQNIATQAAIAMESTTSLIALGHKGADQLDHFIFHNRPYNPDPDLLDLSYGIVPNVVVTGEPVITDDYASHPNASERWVKVGFKACLVVPFNDGDQIIGALGLFSTDPEKSFTLQDMRLAQSIANQVGIGIQKSVLFEETNRRTQELEALYNIALATSSVLDVQTLLHQLQTNVSQLLDPDSYSIYFYHAETEEIETMASVIKGENIQSQIGAFSNLENSGLIGSVLRKNQSILIQDTQKKSKNIDPKSIDEPIRCWLGVPLFSHEQLIGGLSIWSEQPNQFNENDQRLLESLASQVAVSLENARLYEELEDGFLQTVLALANAMDVRDNYTHDHSQRISLLTEKTGAALGCSAKDLENLRLAALLHDIGKIGVPDDVLLKPSELTEEEYEIIKNHPVLGANIVAPVKKLAEVAPIIRSHQEKWDGTGYPDGLKGKEIPLGARILMVVDSYIAITDDRVYRKARSHKEAINELRRLSGKQYDPDVIEIFIKVMEKERV